MQIAPGRLTNLMKPIHTARITGLRMPRICQALPGILLLSFSALGTLAQTHPLDPLSPDELATATATLRADSRLHGGEMFPEITLREPPKTEVLAWQPGQPFRREAFAIVLDLPANRMSEAVVDLHAHHVISWQLIPGAQALLTEQENNAAIDITRTNAAWQAAMRLRGLTNFDAIALTPWAPGHLPMPAPKDARLLRVLAYLQGTQTNSYGPPIEGVEALVDLNQGRVVHLLDTGVRPVPKTSTDYFNPEVRGTNRAALKPLQIVQPEGAAFTVSGQEVSWDRWRFRFGYNTREGLVLYQVRYVDEGRERSILYRASVSEMMVPYGDPDPSWVWRSAFDEGEYGLGKLGAPLIPGQNTAPNATLLSPVLASDAGVVSTFTNRIDLFERPGAGLWSHWEYAAGPTGRRNRELWFGFTATIGNYDYSYHWIFRPDASLEFHVELNGILLMKGVNAALCQACDPGTKMGRNCVRDDIYGTLVAPEIVAANHQHFVNVRLDFDVDGVSNCVKEINVESPKGRLNPQHNAIVASQTVFNRERAAARNLNPGSARSWAIYNPNVKTALGHYPAYVLHPAGNAVPYNSPKLEVRQVATFLDQQFAVTREHDDEMFSGGKYPTLSRRYVTLRDWIHDNESISNQDVVVWYTMGVTHIPRPEDFPIMPSVTTGFTLAPKAFFDRNPALDMPEPDAADEGMK